MGSLADLKSKKPIKSKQGNRYLSDKEKGIELLAKLVSAQSNNNDVAKMLREIEVMIEYEFLALTEKDKCPGSASAYSALQKAYTDLVEIVNFPELENKFTIAVGGQFSSGKSKFLNKIIGAKQLLPTDTSATTAIPTYILAGLQDSVFALNNYQSKTEIDDEALHAISHVFKDKYNLSFSHILKMIAVERLSFKWNNISLLDTPGYSKADSIRSSSDNTDENIAREHLRTSDYLIWLTDIQNGTIPEEDIEFINSLKFDEPILFVLNKADKKTDAQIEEIIEICKENLTQNKINYYDVIGFSAMRNKEYSPSGTVLMKFIDEINSQTAGTQIIKRFSTIFEDYVIFHGSEAEFLRVSRKTINDAFFEAYGKDLESTKLKSLTRKQQKQITAVTNSKKEFESLDKRINQVINNIFTELKIKIVEGYSVKKRKRAKVKEETYKFEAIVQIKDEHILSNLKELKNIEGTVTRAKVIGVTIEMKEKDKVLGDVFITKNEIKKKTSESSKDFFTDVENVIIHFVGDRKAVVEVKKSK